ncbi:hypothetical protein [Pseudoxanthomonas sp. Root630]|uniref:hypothetical protein n=1 Tax=Pseudoxanthomonas sp. Root630 TaxID=1736574 RepID=UPI000B215966|nr:hypothetical protein [Pseudoxanthomonas sp. Root630]
MTTTAPRDWPVVISLHGIRTTGRWQKELTDELVQRGFRHIALDYGYFPAISLILPWTRRRKIRWLLDQYDKEMLDLTAPPSFIAHSYGTYLLTEAMSSNSLMRFDRLILCGSIVRREFPWSTILIDRRQANLVLHETGGRDFWSKVVAWLVSDAGSSGVDGFKDIAKAEVLPGRETELVHEIKHARHKHSDYFFRQNYRERWIPFLEGRIPAKEVPLRAAKTNWKFATIAGVLFGTLVGASALYMTHTPPRPDLEPSADSSESRSQSKPYDSKNSPLIYGRETEPQANQATPPEAISPVHEDKARNASQGSQPANPVLQPKPTTLSTLVAVVNRSCELTFDDENESHLLHAENGTSFELSAGSHTLVCEDGAYSASAEVELKAAEEQHVQLTLELSEDALFMQQSFATLRGTWRATWSKESTPFARCSLQMRAESIVRIIEFDDRNSVIVGAWESSAPVEAVFEPRSNPTQIDLMSEEFERNRCEKPDQWGFWLSTRVPLSAEGRVVLSHADRGIAFELSISECRAHSGGDCESQMIGKNADQIYLTKQGYGSTAFVIERVTENVLKVGDLVFYRQ